MVQYNVVREVWNAAREGQTVLLDDAMPDHAQNVSKVACKAAVRSQAHSHRI